MGSGDVAAIVVAAGSGRRLGADVPKAFVDVGGRPLVWWAIAALHAGGIDRVVVVVPPGWNDHATHVLGPTASAVVEGGATRRASVAAGLAAIPDDVAVVAVHDAARAFVPARVVERVVATVVDSVMAPRDGGARSDASNPRADRSATGPDDPGTTVPIVAAAPGLAVADTLKRVGADDVVAGTVDRDTLVGIQTPQVFPRPVLARAHEAAAERGADATDDLALVELLVAAGTLPGRVVVTPGSVLAFKVTRPDDLAVAAALARTRMDQSPNVTGDPGGPGPARPPDEPGSPGRARSHNEQAR